LEIKLVHIFISNLIWAVIYDKKNATSHFCLKKLFDEDIVRKKSHFYKSVESLASALVS